MLKKLGFEAQESDTVPLWALQAFTSTNPTRTTPTRTTPTRIESRAPALIPAREQPAPPTGPAEGRPEKAGFLAVMVVLFAVLNAADLISTFVGLQSGMHEGNPLMSMLLAKYGFIALIVYKALVVAAVAWGVRTLRAFRDSVANITIVICDLLVLFVVIANVTQFAFKP